MRVCKASGLLRYNFQADYRDRLINLEAFSMNQNEPLGWVLYDDACGFCRKWVTCWGKTLLKHGFVLTPLQSPWVAQRLKLSEEELLHDVRLLLADGRLVLGADVYRYIMQRIWWTYPLYLLSVTPVLRRVFDAGYRKFASNRNCIARTRHLLSGPQK